VFIQVEFASDLKGAVNASLFIGKLKMGRAIEVSLKTLYPEAKQKCFYAVWLKVDFNACTLYSKTITTFNLL
jgi:hypothetical protein